MSRHLKQTLEEAKKYNTNKITDLRSIVEKARTDEKQDAAREMANRYASSLGMKAPNVMSYEEKKGGKSRRRNRKSKSRRKNKKSRKTRKYRR